MTKMHLNNEDVVFSLSNNSINAYALYLWQTNYLLCETGLIGYMTYFVDLIGDMTDILLS